MQNNTDSNIRMFNFANQLSIPQYCEVSNGRNPWILYGENNLYSEYLISLQNRSGKHNAILKGKAAIVGGNGFSLNNVSDHTKLFLKNANDKDTLDAILAKISYDQEIFGAYALNIIWSKDRSKIAQISYIDVSKLRIGKPGNKDGDYFICDDWSQTSKYKPQSFKKFDPENRTAASQILYVKEYRPGNEWYAQPEYISAVNWITLEYEISNFHLSNVANGFHPSMVINFRSGVPTEEEMAMVTKGLQRQYEGASNGGKVIFTFSEDDNSVPVFTPIQLNSSDQRFIQLNSDVESGIYQGHRITNPSLFGVKTPGELGNTSSLQADLIVFNAMYASPKQRTIEQQFQMLAALNGVSDKLKINEFTLNIPITFDARGLMFILNANIPPEAKGIVLKQLGYSDNDVQALVAALKSTTPQPPTA